MIQHYIKTIHFWLKYNGLATVRKTTKLTEGGHRGLHAYYTVSQIKKATLVFVITFTVVKLFSKFLKLAT